MANSLVTIFASAFVNCFFYNLIHICRSLFRYRLIWWLGADVNALLWPRDDSFYCHMCQNAPVYWHCRERERERDRERDREIERDREKERERVMGDATLASYTSYQPLQSYRQTKLHKTSQKSHYIMAFRTHNISYGFSLETGVNMFTVSSGQLSQEMVTKIWAAIQILCKQVSACKSGGLMFHVGLRRTRYVLHSMILHHHGIRGCHREDDLQSNTRILTLSQVC